MAPITASVEIARSPEDVFGLDGPVRAEGSRRIEPGR